MDIIDKIISNFKNNNSLYIGENVTIAEHMIQSAMMAEKSKSKDNLVCACLLHDYGHFILDNPDELVKTGPNGFDIKKLEIAYENADGFKVFSSFTYNGEEYYLQEDSTGKSSAFYVMEGDEV